MSINVHVDPVIYQLNSTGGIRRLWQELKEAVLWYEKDITFRLEEPADVWTTTYYTLPPDDDVPFVFVDYDHIHERLPDYRTLCASDIIDKHRCIQRAQAVLAISQFTADDCLRFTGREAEVMYCGGGEILKRASDPAITAFRQKYGLEKPYVLLVGMRHWHKNIQAFYQAWPMWVGSRNHDVLVIGGIYETAADVAFKNTYEDVWKALNLPDDELAIAYSGAVALVYPSLFEGFGLPVLEAMACGCPVIGATTGSVPEIAGGAAVLVDVTRPGQIAAALQAVNNVEQVRTTMIETGYERAKQFTWEKAAAKFAETVRRIAR